MHIASMTIEVGTPPFGNEMDFKFDERVNVFAGPNASGKSSLLRMLAMPVHDGYKYGGGNRFQYISQFAIAVSEGWPIIHLDEHECGVIWSELPWVQIPATRLHLPWSENLSRILGRSEKTIAVGDGNEALISIFRHGYDWGVFDANQVEIALQLLVDEVQSRPRDGGLRAMRRDSGGNLAGYNLSEAVEISYHCAQQILAEVVTGTSPHNLVTGRREFSDGLFITYPKVRLGMTVDTADGDSVAANLLSSGTQSSLLWIRFLALQMLYHYDFQDGWQNQPAILLIDEIENHLHPTWQRRVIPALLDHFRGLQIFATTHSPFVVAGLKKGQVHMLKRDTDGVVAASTNEHDIIGWTTDEILRTFMGVDEPTDQLTVDRRERLLELRRKDSLTDAEEAEMEELRRQVNEDFLSSSTPLEAQRERYGDMMLEFLRSRQSELSQDGI